MVLPEHNHEQSLIIVSIISNISQFKIRYHTLKISLPFLPHMPACCGFCHT